MKKALKLLILTLCIFTIVGCNKNENSENTNNESQNSENNQDITHNKVDTSILDKKPVVYKKGEKEWNDFEWLKLLPEYPEKDKLVKFEYQEGDYINVWYENADYNKVVKWADSLLDYGFYENREPEEKDNYITIKRRNIELDLRANPYYYNDKTLKLFINRTEYQREVQDAQAYLDSLKNESESTNTETTENQ